MSSFHAYLRTPARTWGTPLVRAAVVDTDATARHGQVELAAREVGASVGSLDDHLLARDARRGEGQLVASAAPAGLAATGDADGGETVRERVADGPRALVTAHVGVTALATGSGVRIGQGLVVLVAHLHGAGDIGLAGPGAAALAAVPVASGRAGARYVLRTGNGGQARGKGEEGERLEGRHFACLFEWMECRKGHRPSRKWMLNEWKD